MEKLKYKHEKFVASLRALERSIRVFSYKDVPDDVREHLVASLIKHFEMCYEAVWKFLKLYLEKRYDLKVDSPKKVFRQCYNVGLINEGLTEQLLDISEARNTTAHDYDQENAQNACRRINSYYETLRALENISLEF